MIKILCILFLFVSSNPLIYGQDNPEIEMLKKSAVYVELLGNSASVFSVNYDRIIKQYKKGYFNASIGFAPYLFKNAYYEKGYNIPASINYSFGKRFTKKNGHFELGTGLGLNRAIDEKLNVNFTRLLLDFRLGYKYQRPSGGFIFKAAYTPIGPVYYFKGTKPKELLEGFELLANLLSVGIGYGF